MTAPEVREAFAAVRQLVPEFAQELVTMLEHRLILAEAMMAMHELILPSTTSAPGDAVTSAGDPAPGLSLVPPPARAITGAEHTLHSVHHTLHPPQVPAWTRRGVDVRRRDGLLPLVFGGPSVNARLYVLAWLLVLGSTLLTPTVLLAVLAWPVWSVGYRAGWRLAGFGRKYGGRSMSAGGVG